MKKISIKNVIEFRRRPEKSRLAFLNSILREKPKGENDGGGDYWVSCLSAIGNVFYSMDKKLIGEKVSVLEDRIEETKHSGTKSRWQKNIDILHSFEDYDFDSLRPDKVDFLKKADSLSIIKIKDFPIESKPHFVFSFENKGAEEVGAVWFIAKKDGYKKSELGMFSDIIYRYLVLNYAEHYKINPKFCIAIDLVNGREVRYSELMSGDISFLLDNTVAEMRKLRPA